MMVRPGSPILGVHIDALTWQHVVARVLTWALAHESRYVCVCNVHSVVTAKRSASFRRVLGEADLATPDGMPLVWWLRRAGFSHQARIDGPELMLRLCKMAAWQGIPVFLYGGTETVLSQLQIRLREQFPELRIAGSVSPPFRPLTPLEEMHILEQIEKSGAGIVFVGLGCPKQESWMREHRGRLPAVMVGVGAAFDFHAGLLRRAPVWMQRAGLEWLYRLSREPGRLWRRYLTTNLLFMMQATVDSVTGHGPRSRNAVQPPRRKN